MIEVEMEAERREPDRCEDHLRYLRVERRMVEALIQQYSVPTELKFAA
jgi:hypothetical protein